MNPRQRSTAVCLAALCLGFLAGCYGGSKGPEVGKVSGLVTLDGKPLENAAVYFEPARGRTSSGLTDKHGHYELSYTKEIKGAEVGGHTVRITREPTVDEMLAQGTNPQAKQPDPLPERYNVNSELKAEVKPGGNTCNFELTSK
jgi:hypothetical protein